MRSFRKSRVFRITRQEPRQFKNIWQGFSVTCIREELPLLNKVSPVVVVHHKYDFFDWDLSVLFGLYNDLEYSIINISGMHVSHTPLRYKSLTVPGSSSIRMHSDGWIE